MTEPLDDARGELLALAENYLANNAAESGADVLIKELAAALRAAPARCDAVTATLRQNIQSKLAQLKHYRDHDCQLDHARTIAEGRIVQLEQVSHWVEMAALSPDPGRVAVASARGNTP